MSNYNKGIDSKGINEWLSPYTYEGSQRDYRIKRKEERENSFNVRLCPECSRAYESVYVPGSHRVLKIYEDFPTYRLKREVCTTCEK